MIEGAVMDPQAVLAAMATPAMLLMANAMLVLSTNQRLQSILRRVWEGEEMYHGNDHTAHVSAVMTELEAHGRRARLAHRALLALYASAAVLLVMIGALGSASLGFPPARLIALAAAFVGSGLLLIGAALLAMETWIGVGAVDGRIRRLVLSHRAESPD
jgi:hypothetical protein